MIPGIQQGNMKLKFAEMSHLHSRHGKNRRWTGFDGQLQVNPNLLANQSRLASDIISDCFTGFTLRYEREHSNRLTQISEWRVALCSIRIFAQNQLHLSYEGHHPTPIQIGEKFWSPGPWATAQMWCLLK